MPYDDPTLSRRDLLRMGAAAALVPLGACGGATLATPVPSPPPSEQQPPPPPPVAGAELEEATVVDLQAMMRSGAQTARSLTAAYLARIEAFDRAGPILRSVIETNPEALEIAERLDAERAAGRVRGPLHGIPVLIKDNIDTADRMQTTAGSLALVGSPALRDAGIVERLRAAGAVVLGKTNLSEWANFRSTRASSGWSARGGQVRNPYVLDRSPCGSSSGSGAAVAANLAALAVGTETDGSIVCPAAATSVVGIKPTLGLVSRSGIVPIAHSQDTAGPMTRTVADAAALLTVLAGADPRDAATAPAATRATDYTQFLDPNGLRGARIGIPRGKGRMWGYHEHTDRVGEEAIAALRAAGADIIDPVELPHAGEYDGTEFTVLLYEFKADLNAYLATRTGVPIRTLADAIRFNEEHRDREMPYFRQEIFEMAQAKGPLTSREYRDALAANQRLAGRQGIDAVMARHRLDALLAPTSSPTWPIDVLLGDHFLGGSSSPAAVAGYPSLTVPAGYVHGLPVGMTFFGRAWSEPTLIRLAYAFEQATRARRRPGFTPTISMA